MVSSLLNASSILKPSPANSSISAQKFGIPFQPCQLKPLPIVSCRRKPEHSVSAKNGGGISYSPAPPPLVQIAIQKSLISVAAAASIAIVFWSSPAQAGFLSGYTGIESVPGPELPQLHEISTISEENQKMYAENDARFKESPILKKLLEQSKLNKEKNRQETQDKYCIRGAEWGVGDCSAEGMSPEDKEKFISALKKKAGIE
ncbi:hypothetical protein MIMGU_mgv1a014054mg [Erythranthe guttata]|uniref:Uncharacterized protein n=1 Tax=Erythranthe guttata TaxID=4155 RepID=A0A022QMJ7_ERYGU|nr:hypothetical protein MIMGU_mgv1a014054mg [Erythranthe guttata]